MPLQHNSGANSETQNIAKQKTQTNAKSLRFSCGGKLEICLFELNGFVFVC
jgi:hypothetical protein